MFLPLIGYCKSLSVTMQDPENIAHAFNFLSKTEMPECGDLHRALNQRGAFYPLLDGRNGFEGIFTNWYVIRTRRNTSLTRLTGATWSDTSSTGAFPSRTSSSALWTPSFTW